MQGSISEFELIKQLQSPPHNLFHANVFADELSLFQTHFIVHNALYRIRDKGLANKEFDLDTLTTEIRLIKLTATSGMQLAEESRPEIVKLREYYLDWQNFSKTDEQDVLELLSGFWQKYSQYDFKQIQTEQLDEALSAMEFTSLPTLTELKQKYKKLSVLHHPDKGGSAQAFTQLQHNYQIIKLFIR